MTKWGVLVVSCNAARSAGTNSCGAKLRPFATPSRPQLLAALHCFNPQVMPADQANHFVISLAGECLTKEQRDGVRGSLEFLLTLPEVVKRAKDNTVQDLSISNPNCAESVQ